MNRWLISLKCASFAENHLTLCATTAMWSVTATLNVKRKTTKITKENVSNSERERIIHPFIDLFILIKVKS
jgi:hypothetical protein